MEAKTSIIHKIVSRLKALGRYRIMLFGSHTSESAKSESDIDLLVILDSEDIPQTFEQRMQNRLHMRERIQSINRQFAIALVVYTRGEYEYLQRQGSSFLQEIDTTGKTLYEKAGNCKAGFCP